MTEMAVASVTAIGFDPARGVWRTDDGSQGLARPPALAGELVIAGAELDAAAHDQGNTAHVRPGAILRPAETGDVAKMVRFCREFSIRVAPRGTAHTSFGQSLVDGLSIDMRSLQRVHAITADDADVDAGALWEVVIAGGWAQGVRPLNGVPAVLRLTVGGVLSIGGVSTSRTGGAVVDAVRELEVVTGAGDVVTCSRGSNSALFESVLGGLGQFGIITRARLAMAPVAPLVRGYALRYERRDLADALADQRTLADRDGVDELLIRWAWEEGAPPVAELGAYAYFDEGAPPDDARLMDGLTRAPIRVTDMTYVERTEAVDRRYADYESRGWSGCQKMWSDHFLPDHASDEDPAMLPDLLTEEFIGTVLDEITARDWSPTSTALLFRKQRDAFELRGLRLPDPARGRHLCLLAIASDNFGKPDDPSYVSDLKARNRRWFDLARDAGGTLYPLGATDLGIEDWAHQYGDRYELLCARKRDYDPDGILTPGPGIF